MVKLTVLPTTGSSTGLPERLTTAWTPDQQVPAETAASLPSAITEAEALTTAIDSKTLAVLLAQTFKLWNPPDDFDDTAPFYREALEDVPLDLVQSALKHIRQTLKWFPKPCELRAPIEVELRRRRDMLRRLKLMEQKVRLGDVESPALRAVRSPEETAAGVEAAEKTKQLLANTSLKRVPGHDEDRKERRPVSLREAYETLRADGIDPHAWRKGATKHDRRGSDAGADASEADRGASADGRKAEDPNA